MKLTYYNSAKFEKTTTVEVAAILSTPEPEELTDDDRAALRSGDMISMCNFAVKGDNYPASAHWMAVPWNWVIEIIEDSGAGWIASGKSPSDFY